jgi:hypothetical protein
MELLKAPLILMNNKKKKKQKSGETHARISQKNFTVTDGRTDGELTKNFTFSNFFENRMLAGAHSF